MHKKRKKLTALPAPCLIAISKNFHARPYLKNSYITDDDFIRRHKFSILKLDAVNYFDERWRQQKSTTFFGKESSTGEKVKSYRQEIGYDENAYLRGQWFDMTNSSLINVRKCRELRMVG